jgi:hypothetical protein
MSGYQSINQDQRTSKDDRDDNELTRIEVTTSHDDRLDYLKSCFEPSVYTRAACTSSGALFQALLIAFAQIFIPYRIIVANLDNISACNNLSVELMPCDTIIVGTIMMYYLWLSIINDTAKSMKVFEFLLGLKNLPRRWIAILGMLITPIGYCLTGVAGSIVLLSAETTMVDIAKDSMALFFINRMDEDFGGLHSMVGLLSRYIRKDKLVRVSDEADDIADSLEQQYGPWDGKAVNEMGWWMKLAALAEMLTFISAFCVPFFYFLCAI